ncbi:hypothetical protein IOD13_06900 [Brevibacterium casei]|nr:hypothetical protein [Brevibacterium casei]
MVERTDTGIRVAARMTTSAEIGGQEERFEAEDVVFTLTEHEGAWRIAEVAEVECRRGRSVDRPLRAWDESARLRGRDRPRSCRPRDEP